MTPPAAAHPPALDAPVHLAGDLWQVAGSELTHAWDGAAYVLLGSSPTLVDCGSGLGHDRLVGHLATLGVEVGDLRCVLATHGHFDHLAGLARLREEDVDLPVLVHAAERADVEEGDSLRTCASLLYGCEAPRLRVDAPLVDGDLLDLGGVRVEVLHTPGHSPGSSSLVVETGGRRVLLAGDAVWGGFHPMIGSDLAAWQATMDRLSALDVDSMSFGHGVHHLVEDAPRKLADAAARLGWFFDPWFERPAAVQPEPVIPPSSGTAARVT